MSTISSHKAAPAVEAAAPAKRPEAAVPGSAAPPKDPVQLSSAAQAALREATETSAQTAKEASSGDVQAKHLLARQTVHVIA